MTEWLRLTTGLTVRALGLFVAGAVLLAGCAGGTTITGTENVVTQVPFASGEVAVYELLDVDGAVIGRGTLTVEAQDGRLRFEQRFVESEPATTTQPASDLIVVVTEIDTLKPVGGGREITRASGVEQYGWTYIPPASPEHEVRLEVERLDEGGGDGDADEMNVREHHYDNESSLWLWRTLAFSEQYEARYVSVSAIERNQQAVDLSISERNTVEVPAGTFETYRLLVRNGRATRVAWINVEPPHQVVRWDNGEQVFQLVQFDAGGVAVVGR